MTKELKSRLRTLKSTHKITSAMKIVAATAFNRLKHNASPMFYFLESLIALSTQVQRPITSENNRRLLIVIGGDRGLCGGYNAAIRKKATQYLKDFPDAKVAYIGTKIVLKEYKGIFTETVQTLGQWTVLLDKLQPLWIQYGVIDIVYTVFQTLYDQQVTLISVIPEGERPVRDLMPQISVPLLDETSIDIFPLIYTAMVMEAIVHAQLCEFSTRMLSMDNATQNAEKMIEALQLKINKMRQAMITKELSETMAGSINI
jgi:F-type H+-transporting ATPase subunit gamma